jgi:hypothetical protein
VYYGAEDLMAYDESADQQEIVHTVKVNDSAALLVIVASWKEGPWKVGVVSQTSSRGRQFTSSKFPRVPPEVIPELTEALVRAAEIAEERNT